MSDTKASLEIRHDSDDAGGAFVVPGPEVDGGPGRLAAMVYRRRAPDRVTIVHTEVDDSLRGQGVARRLLDALVAWARATGARVAATCPYAKAQLDKDESLRDVYDA
ncbi:MAG: N-acetyltransferase [Deltaproteobacteria bacterium]|nr:N-acetyltransferase [Deltaproteobacteria bacterium]